MSGKLRAVTPVRTLPNVLRQALSDRETVRLDLGEVTNLLDERHVEVRIGGELIVVPRLSSYAPNVGDVAYLLCGAYWTVAIGTVSVIPSGGTVVGGDLTYVHTQSVLAATWLVEHHLGKYPAVDVVDSGGSVVIPDVLYIDENTVQLTFGAATSGKAYVN